jgi:hypothetical protein
MVQMKGRTHEICNIHIRWGNLPAPPANRFHFLDPEKCASELYPDIFVLFGPTVFGTDVAREIYFSRVGLNQRDDVVDFRVKTLKRGLISRRADGCHRFEQNGSNRGTQDT